MRMSDGCGRRAADDDRTDLEDEIGGTRETDGGCEFGATPPAKSTDLPGRRSVARG